MTEPGPTSETIDPSQQNSLSESVFLLERFRSGDESAATELFERFAKRLASLVQSRLSRKLARRMDAEDVMLSAYRSFFVRARAGQFEVHETGELWRLLAQITLNKLYRSAEWHTAARRTPTREHDESCDLVSLAAAGCSPELETIVADQLEFLMSQLPEATCRVLELQLQGHEVEEIATLIGRSPRTVRRQLEAIRETFSRQAEKDDLFNPNTIGAGKQATTRTPMALRLNETIAKHRTLDEFVLRRQIGLGLTGRVYEAFDKQQQQLVAVKVLRKSLLADRSLRERFEAEADLVARLHHPGIVRIHGHGETPNRGWFLVMDLLPDGDLIPFAGPTLAIEQAVDWVRQIAVAIGHAHAKGLIHCDLKPANLLLSVDQRAVVTDFGFAQIHGQTTKRAACLAGTPAFMAPEQIDPSWGEVCPQTDIYGLGAVLHFLLTGRPPVSAVRMNDLFDEVVSTREISTVAKLRPDVPSWVAEACAQCLRKPINERFASMNDLLTALS